jgi:hypothetical protein
MVMLLALQRTAEAGDALAATIENLDAKPLTERLNYLTSLTADLVELARDRAEARGGAKGILARLGEYAAGLPAEARTDAGSLLIVVHNNLSAAGVWAGDHEYARRQAESALAINPDYVLARANLGAALLVAGDAAGAVREYDAAISSAASYLKGPDGAGLEGSTLAAASAAVRSELDSAAGALQALVEQMPELGDAARPLIDRLRQAAGEYGE